jgi:hypothetical protein
VLRKCAYNPVILHDILVVVWRVGNLGVNGREVFGLCGC